VLSQALLSGAAGELRNMATVGGSLLQRTRCLYFHDITTACNKREPGWAARRSRATTGITRSSAPHGRVSRRTRRTWPSPWPRSTRWCSPGGRTGAIPLTELYRLPGEAPERDTVLAHGEVITAVDLPPLSFASHSGYRKVRDRASYGYALVSVAAALDVADGVVRNVRLALGGVAHKPWRATKAEQAVRGAPATVDGFAAAAEAELGAAKPLADNAFKVPLVGRVLLSMLLELAKEQR
jgi:xanthine dehydrogenase YagS FAD-binding subunit